MEYAVIYFSPANAVGEQLFKTFAEAEYFDNTMLDAGYTTSGVLFI